MVLEKCFIQVEITMKGIGKRIKNVDLVQCIGITIQIIFRKSIMVNGRIINKMDLEFIYG
jgi:hypothetical protein